MTTTETGAHERLVKTVTGLVPDATVEQLRAVIPILLGSEPSATLAPAPSVAVTPRAKRKPSNDYPVTKAMKQLGRAAALDEILEHIENVMRWPVSLNREANLKKLSSNLSRMSRVIKKLDNGMYIHRSFLPGLVAA